MLTSTSYSRHIETLRQLHRGGYPPHKLGFEVYLERLIVQDTPQALVATAKRWLSMRCLLKQAGMDAFNLRERLEKEFDTAFHPKAEQMFNVVWLVVHTAMGRCHYDGISQSLYTKLVALVS